MFNLGSKAFFLAAPVAFIAAVLYAFNTSDVGGFVVLLGAAVVALFLGAASVAATGSADRFNIAGLRDPRAGRAPNPNAVPFIAAVGAGVIGLGFAFGVVAFAAGLIVLAVSAVVWFGAGWREHPDYVGSTAPRVGDRFSLPIGLPVGVIGVIAIAAISISRLFLTVSKTGSWVAALIIGVAIFAIALILAFRPTISKRFGRALMAIGIAALIAVGVVGVSRGERPFHHHEGAAAATETK